MSFWLGLPAVGLLFFGVPFAAQGLVTHDLGAWLMAGGAAGSALALGALARYRRETVSA